MLRRLMVSVSLVCALAMAGCGGGSEGGSSTGTTVTPGPAASGGYTLLAWSELGMHCMDGADYSVMSILPPYNTVHAQLVKQAEPPQVVSSGVTITYAALVGTAVLVAASIALQLLLQPLHVGEVIIR